MYRICIWDTDNREWNLSDEGPWNDLESAKEFARAEVGMPWIIIDGHLSAPDKIREWVQREFNPKYHDCVTQDLIDVAVGNRNGNQFEQQALSKIFPEWSNQ